MPNYDVLPYLQAAGFKGEALRKAWAITQRESGGRASAHNYNPSTKDDSYGLFQINMLGDLGPARQRQYGLKKYRDLLDPATNASVAYKMSKGGTDFGAWAIGPNAYKGAPANAASKFQEFYDQWDPSQVNARGSQSRAPASVGAGRVSTPPANNDAGKRLLAAQLIGQVLNQTSGGRINSNIFAQAIGNQRQPEPMPTSQFGPAHGVPRAALNIGTYDPSKGTHVTDGLGWGTKTAQDIMAKPGTVVKAWTSGTVKRLGSAQGGQSMYFMADDGKEYWLGHVDGKFSLPSGTRVKAGDVLTRISADHANPHLHIDSR